MGVLSKFQDPCGEKKGKMPLAEMRSFNHSLLERSGSNKIRTGCPCTGGHSETFHFHSCPRKAQPPNSKARGNL
ncbi:hypothetical protein EYF80_040271 [Liparis tanakae]|uniref:Uncharacterized protein n=1 Tax=Liparis tanakae TaxID=230148 RepID=A0A4Z2G8D2_9TELE|nr:hypothetical protein EYF80_040271 [Liparis tanakae]